MNNKSAKSPSKITPEKSNTTTVTHKHSAPFYISPALFHNKRLKQRRWKWATASKTASSRKIKTDRRKQKLSTLKADITIDLLSDDETNGNVATTSIVNNNNCILEQKKFFTQALNLKYLEPVGQMVQQQRQPQRQEQPQQLQRQTQQQRLTQQQEQQRQPQQQPAINNAQTTNNHLQHFIVYPNGPFELSKVPNITLIPVQQLSIPSLQKSVKRKRKSRPPKRHAEPTIVNNESIVLTDDSDSDATFVTNVGAAVIAAPSSSCKRSANVHAAAINNANSTAVQLLKPAISIPATIPPAPNAPPPLVPITSACMAQVDDEVTVSIVPRSSTAGNCVTKPTTNELFPMLPDETTVHTVIANRIYELSLTKLREGLASCGVGDFADSQQKVSPTRRKVKTNPPPPVVTPQQQPISLKLSSDLSISLISDDEEDENQQRHQQLSAEKLLQQQPQLSVQHVQLPAITAAADGRQLPRRRKLG